MAAPAPADPFGGGAPAAAADPFGGGATANSTNPFGGGGAPAPSADPFGGGAPANTNPFGGGAPAADPFGGTTTAASSDPFGGGYAQPAPRADFQPMTDYAAVRAEAEEAKTQEVALALPKFVRNEAELPEVQAGYDGMVFGMTKDFPVDVRLNAQSDWQTRAENTSLKVGSEIRTHKTPQSQLLLRGKRDQLYLPEQSHIELRELSADHEEVMVYLHSGAVFSNVSPRSEPDAYKVQTPELTAGVRGTFFKVARNMGVSEVQVIEGVVQVTARKTGVYATLEKGEKVAVNADGQIMKLIASPVSRQQIFDQWDQWAEETALGSGSLAQGVSPIAGLSDQIAQDNARWENSMQEYMQTEALNKYDDTLRGFAKAFERFASDTGHIPETEEGWSLLIDEKYPGWAGPYVENKQIPPMDPYGRPLRYRKLVSPSSGNVFGYVYSIWLDARDQGAEPGSDDKKALIMYYDLPRFRNNQPQ
jgi:hypothetical protein